MKAYIVTYKEWDEDEKEFWNELSFYCLADDFNHAEEQCLNAYPECKIISIHVN